MVSTDARPIPPIEILDQLSPTRFVETMAPLFEGAQRFLGHLAAARPFGSIDRLFERAKQVARAMPAVEQLELIDAHPRLGAPPPTVSALSFVEQGYARDAADQAVRDADGERSWVAAELDRLNAAYEERFGFRYCVFVAGRSRAELLPGMEAALHADRPAEIDRALNAVIDIARSRADRLRAPAGRGA